MDAAPESTDASLFSPTPLHYAYSAEISGESSTSSSSFSMSLPEIGTTLRYGPARRFSVHAESEMGRQMVRDTLVSVCSSKPAPDAPTISNSTVAESEEKVSAREKKRQAEDDEAWSPGREKDKDRDKEKEQKPKRKKKKQKSEGDPGALLSPEPPALSMIPPGTKPEPQLSETGIDREREATTAREIGSPLTEVGEEEERTTPTLTPLVKQEPV